MDELEGDRAALAAVQLSDVTRTYHRGQPVNALVDISLSLSRGSYTAVMGPSGSGKSTLLNCIGCLDTPDSGSIYVDGTEVTGLTDRQRARVRGRQIGFVFQTFNLMPRLTALENVALPLVFQGVDRSKRLARARELLESVGLADRTDHHPSELSGGQRQRVAIARALVTNPALLLADEPTGNIDSETGATIMELFDDLQRDGHTILLVTHERAIAEHADGIVHLRDGRIERIEDLAQSDDSTPDRTEDS
ncbi:MAG: ABC transporter ATP-binding protein [Halorientalis sp.]